MLNSSFNAWVWIGAQVEGRSGKASRSCVSAKRQKSPSQLNLPHWLNTSNVIASLAVRLHLGPVFALMGCSLQKLSTRKNTAVTKRATSIMILAPDSDDG